MQKNIVRIVPFRTYNLNSMSERLSQTAGETVDRTQETLLKRAMGFLSTPAGKIIGGAAIVLGAAAATQKAAADTVACVTKPTEAGVYPSLIIDNLETTNNDDSLQATQADKFNSEGVDILNGKIFKQTGFSTFKLYDETLSKIDINGDGVTDANDKISDPATCYDYFIPRTNLRLGGAGTFFEINDPDAPTAFEQKGYVEGVDVTLNSVVSDGENIFIATRGDTDSQELILKAKISSITATGANNPISSTPLATIDNMDPFSSGALFFDEFNEEIIRSYRKIGGTKYGYQEFNANGAVGTFIEVSDTKIIKGCADILGNRYLLTEPDQDGNADVIVIDSNGDVIYIHKGIKPLLTEDPNTMKPLPSGGVLLIEKGQSFPTMIDQNNTPIKLENGVNQSGDPLYECAVFQEDPFPIDLCENFDPAEHEDENPCTEASCNQDTGDINQLPGNEGEPCDDKNPDTDSDKCEAGACQGTPIVTTDVIEGEDVTVEPTPDAGSDVIDDGAVGDEGVAGDEGGPDAPDAVEPDDIIGDEGGPDAPDAVDPTDTITENDYRPEVTELPTDVGEENDYRGEDVIKDVSIEDIINIDANNPDIVTEEGKGGGGCSSVPNGVNDTRTGVAAVMLAALAALSGSRWRRREDEVKLNK